MRPGRFDMATMRRACVPALLGACIAAVGGCAQPLRVAQADAAERVDVDTFMHEHLPVQSIVTVAEAYRAMTILVDGDDQYDDFASRAAALEDRGIMRPAWELEREAPVDRGSIAYMVCQILRIRGEVNLMLFGSAGLGDRRYALRELSTMGIMDETPPYRYISGGELLGLMARADALMAEKGIYEEEPVDVVDFFDDVDAEAAPGARETGSAGTPSGQDASDS